MHYLTRFSEHYLILLALLAGYTPPFSFNPLALGLAAIIILQIIYRNKTAGLTIAVLLSAINVYMLLAMISEFNEIPAFNAGAKKMLMVGVPLFIVNMVMFGVMLFKYAGNKLIISDHN